MMSEKLHACNICNKKLSSYYSLWRHKRNGICQEGDEKNFSDYMKPVKHYTRERPVNLKIAALADTIINDDSTNQDFDLQSASS